MSTVRGWHQWWEIKFCFRKNEEGCEPCEGQGLDVGDKLVWSDAWPLNKQDLEEVKVRGGGLDFTLGEMTVPSHRWKYCSKETCLVAPLLLHMYHPFLCFKYCTVGIQPTSDFLTMLISFPTPSAMSKWLHSQNLLCCLYFCIRNNTLTFSYSCPEITEPTSII